jgi:hypothetical protein
MMRRLRALLLLLLSSSSALAAPPGKEEFDEAKRLFDAGQPREALPLFEKAYQLSNQRPSTILALALCERELQIYDRALLHLDEYLRAEPVEHETYASLRAELQAKVAALQPEVEPPPPPPAPVIETPPPAIVNPPPIEDDPGPSALKISLLSSGGAAIATGVVFAVLAARAESDVKTGLEEGRASSSALSNRAQEGFRFAVTADVLIIAGVAAAGVGLFLD